MPRKSVKRENGSGSVYKRSDIKRRPWVAIAPANLSLDNNDKLKATRMVIGYYETAAEARSALAEYLKNPTEKINITLEQLHEEWLPIGYKHISNDLKNNYNSCWYKLRPLYKRRFRDIRTGDMQAIIDYYDSEHAKEGIGGKPVFDKDNKPVMRGPLSFSSLSKIKALLTLMYGYAMQNDIVNKNYASFISLPDPGETKKDRFTDLELQQIKHAIGKIPMADIIYVMCNTGHRIGEFLALTANDVVYHGDHLLLSGGNKTDAGSRKVVPVNSSVRPIVEYWINQGGDTIFCRDDGRQWTTDRFREKFKNCLAEIGVRVLTPHATRRTFSTRLSAAGTSKEDIIALMGHTDFDVDIKHYINQEVDTLIKAVERLA